MKLTHLASMLKLKAKIDETVKITVAEEIELEEDTDLQGLGKSLKPGSKPAKTPVGDEPAVEEPEDEVEPTGEDASVEPEGEVEPEAKWAVDQLVKPLTGPHKGEIHTIVQVFPDGKVLISPKNLQGDSVKYRNGSVRAKPDQIEAAEVGAPVTKEGLFKAVTSDVLSEAGRTFSATSRREVDTKPKGNSDVGDGKKFRVGQKVLVKKTGKEVEILSFMDSGTIWTVSTDPKDLAVNSFDTHTHKFVGGKDPRWLGQDLRNGRGHQEYLPRELEFRSKK